jgi:NTE family protein
MLAGETVGEMALLSGEPRSATVAALRDTELLRLSKAGFAILTSEHPKSLRVMLVRRLREPRSTGASDAIKTMAIIPLSPGTPESNFVPSLERAFEALGIKTCAVGKEWASRPVECLNALEEAHGVVLYQGSRNRRSMEAR